MDSSLNIKSKKFDLFSLEAFFTDDSVLTVVLAEAISNKDDYGQVMKKYYTIVVILLPDMGAHSTNGLRNLPVSLTIVGATGLR